MDKRLDWTTKELAELTKLDQSTFRHLLLNGKLKGYKRGQMWFIPDEEVQRWLKTREG